MQPTRFALGLCAATLALATSSCALSSQRADERATEWTRAYLDARCRYHVRCEAQFGAYASRYQADCHPGLRALVLLERAAEVGTTFDFDEGRAERCLAALESAPCRVSSRETFDPDLAECEAVVTGAVPEGSACDPARFACADHGTCVASAGTCGGVCVGRAARGETCRLRGCVDGTQCAFEIDGRVCRAFELEPGAECHEREQCRAVEGRPHLCTEGRCAPLPIAALGEACGDAVALCPEGAGCVERICVPRVGQGVLCRALEECEEGLICDGPTPEGRCARSQAECFLGADCPAERPHCVYDEEEGQTRCSADPTGARCEPGAWGWATSSSGAFDSCPESHRCDPYSLGSPTCLPIVAEGAACDARHLCADGTRCDAGVCVALVGPGDACGSSALCPLTHHCVGGACAPLPSLGEPCTGACFEGGCRAGTCELLGEGEPCDVATDGYIRRCRHLCVGGVCTDEGRVSTGAPCGLGVAVCDHELVCVAQAGDTGLCRAPCE